MNWTSCKRKKKPPKKQLYKKSLMQVSNEYDSLTSKHEITLDDRPKNCSFTILCKD